MVTTAYLFFHAPLPNTDAALYAGRLIHFHERLQATLNGSTWYRGSVAFRHPAPPDVTFGSPVFSDWYLLADLANLGDLNFAATVGDLATLHSKIAAMSQNGAGAVYSYVAGEDAVPHGAKFAYWLRRPADLNSDSLRARLARIVLDVPNAAAWQRQMALGPSPELVITSPTPIDIAPMWQSYYTELDEI